MQYVTNAFNFNYSWAQVPPLAVATVDQASVNERINVTLDGSASSSPEGRPISIYNWSELDANQPVFLVRNGSKATFQAPNVTGLSPVNYTFRLTVTDANGLVSMPSDVNVTVNNVNETVFPTPTTSPIPFELPPHTIGTSPANGSINIPTKSDKLTATFDQDIDSSSAKISLKDTTGNEIPVDVTSDGPSVTIIPKSNLNPGTNYTVSIDQISGKGKTNVGSVIFGFTTVPEAPPVELPPHTIGTSPANGSINIPTKSDKLTATFDQDIDSSSAKISLKDTTGNEIPVDVTSDGPSVTIIPKSNLNPGTNYTVSIDQISGKGKTNVGSVIFGFTTVPEAPPVELPPHTIGTSPANGSINIPTKSDKLTATFDQDIDSSSAKISLKDTTGNEIPVDVTSDGPSVTIIPKSNLNPGTNYTVSIDQISGKGKTNVGSVIFGFTTVPEVTTPPTPTSENHPPEAQNQQVTTEAGKPVDIALGAIDNDTGDTLSAAIVTPPQPNHGSLGKIDQNTGNVTFTPAAGFSGNDSFTFKVIDSHQAESNVGTVSITVTPPVPLTQPPTPTPTPTSENHPPEAQNQQVTTEAGKPVDIALGAIDNDTGDTLSAAIVTPPQPNHGSLGKIDQNTGNVTFTPAAGFSGNDSFTFKVIDSHQAESNVGTVSITVTPPVPLTQPPTPTPTPTSENHPPEAQNQQVTTEAGKPVDIALGAIDNDTGDTLSAAIVTPPQPNHGSLGKIDQNTGNVTFTPATGFSGNDSFTFKVIDSHQAESNVGTVSITVTPPVPLTQPPPKLIESAPQNGSSDVSTTIDKIEATFNDRVNVGSATISLKDDSGKDIQITTSAEDSKVTIIPKSKLIRKLIILFHLIR